LKYVSVNKATDLHVKYKEGADGERRGLQKLKSGFWSADILETYSCKSDSFRGLG